MPSVSTKISAPTAAHNDEFVVQAAACAHCGNDCKQADYAEKWQKYFCCEGCELVYGILQENKLGYYYALDEQAGKRVQKAQSEEFAYLDNAEIQGSLLDFAENGIAKIQLSLPQIHCTSCVWLLENLHRLDAGVLRSTVNFGLRRANISFDQTKTSLRKIAELLASIGYAPSIQYDSLRDANKGEGSPKISESRRLIYKIGIAGFCFGNAMMLNFPDYLAISPQSVAEYQQVFNYISLALALPIVTVCASDYFRSAWQNLRRKVVSIDLPLSLGILALFVWSLVEIVSGAGTGYVDSLSGLVFLLLSGKWYQQKTFESLSFERDYKSYFPVAVQRLNTDGGTELVSLQQIEVGDSLRIRSEELIPADAVLLSSTAKIDYSFVSGESAPIRKQQGEALFAGGRQVGSSIEIVVQRRVNQSYLTSLWNEQNFGKREQTRPIRFFLDQIGWIFTLAIIVLAVGTGIYWSVVDSSKLALTLSAVLIVACPCVMVLSLPFTFGNAMRLLGRGGLYLKNNEAVERISQVDTLVFDKTGTLSHSQNSEISWQGEPLTVAQASAIFALVRHSTHPLSQALTAYLQEQFACADYAVAEFEEKPALGLQASVEGQIWRIGAMDWLQCAQQASDQSPSAARVALQMEGQNLGYFSIEKQYREGLTEVLTALGKKYELHLLSGDKDSERQRLSAFFKPENMRFGCSPADKLNFIRSLQAQGRRVLMLGDGLNDAGALRQSDAGIAIVEDISLFSPASDAILDARSFAQLPDYLQYTRRALWILRLSFGISLTYNIVGLSFAVQGLLTPLIAALLMPFSSVSVVAFVTLATWLARPKKSGLI